MMEFLHFLLVLSIIHIHSSLLGEGSEGGENDHTNIQRWGEPPLQREHLDMDPSSRVMIISPKTMFSRTGNLGNWTVNFGHTNGSVRLQVWRMRSADQENYRFYYELIGQTDYQSAADAGNGTHTFEIWPRIKIRVAPNDTIGIQWKDANPISYDLRGMPFCSSDEQATRVYPADTYNMSLVEGNEYEYLPLTNSECRQYSLQVTMEIKECKDLVATAENQVEQIFKQRMDADYCWIVAPSDTNHIIRLELLQERSVGEELVNNCSFVAMEIRTGRPAITSNLNYKTCHMEYHQMPFEAENLGIYLRLVTSSITAFPASLAIMMSYSSKSINKTCEELSIYDSNELIVQSPGFPLPYSSNEDVCWIIFTTDDKRLRIDVVESDLEQSYGEDHMGCVDYVAIFDGASEQYPLVNKWCGMDLPNVMITSTNVAFVRFYSGPYQQFRGFKMTFRAVPLDERICTELQVTAIRQFLYSPGYPHSTRDDEDICWNLKAAEGFRVMMQVHDSIMEGDDQECLYDVVIIRDGLAASSNLLKPLLRRWCGEKFPKAPIITSGRSAFIHLQTDSSVGGFGFYLSYVQVHTDACTEFAAYLFDVELTAQQLLRTSPTVTCIILMTDLPEHHVRLELIQPFNSDDCAQNSITIYDADDPDEEMVSRWCHKTDNPVVSGKGNALKLLIKTSTQKENITFRISYKAVDDGCIFLTIDGESNYGFLNSPVAGSWDDEEEELPLDSPVKYLPNLDVCWIVDSPAVSTFLKIRLMFLDVEGKDDNGKCTKDFLEIRDGENKDSPLLALECGHHTVQEYHTSGRFAFIRFATNSGVELRGFHLRFFINETKGRVDCPVIQASKNFTVFTSPGYPEPYNALEDVCWVINTTAPKRIQLLFIDYAVEAGCLDFLEIYDGNSEAGIPMHVVCWPDTPKEIESTGSAIFLRFRSDYSVQGRGFKIKARSITKSSSTGTCIHKIVGDKQKDLSLDTYPNPYDPDVDMCWILTTPKHDQRVLLVIARTDILKTDACTEDYIKILDGPFPTSEPLHRWCGNTLPADMVTSGRSVFVHFKAGPRNSEHTGFLMSYVSLEGATPEPIGPRGRDVPDIRRPYFYLILAGIIGLVIIIVVVALLAACIILRNRRKKERDGNPEIRMNQNNISLPGPVLNATSDLGADAGPLDSKGIRLNPDGSASYNTAFENPGYATLPGADG